MAIGRSALDAGDDDRESRRLENVTNRREQPRATSRLRVLVKNLAIERTLQLTTASEKTVVFVVCNFWRRVRSAAALFCLPLTSAKSEGVEFER